ncbi:MarR family winged helix-turn-helix transcriptional regulator [Streptomyces sp. NPDC093085]|uniref:MarR family winged helix-turn-helix transcriptional regulator n=1 Tax=Streptomyces sp. NPDC093085 TaxID=3155068 RepID=UPI00344AEE28
MSTTTPRWLNAEERRAWISYVDSTTLPGDHLDRQLRREVGITHADYALLGHLESAPSGALGMSELAERLNITRSRLTRAVARIEHAGYLERLDHPTDRHGQLAVLTVAGAALREAAAPSHVEAVRQAVFDDLAPEQICQFIDTHEAITAAPQDSSADSLPCIGAESQGRVRGPASAAGAVLTVRSWPAAATVVARRVDVSDRLRPHPRHVGGVPAAQRSARPAQAHRHGASSRCSSSPSAPEPSRGLPARQLASRALLTGEAPVSVVDQGSLVRRVKVDGG